MITSVQKLIQVIKSNKNTVTQQKNTKENTKKTTELTTKLGLIKKDFVLKYYLKTCEMTLLLVSRFLKWGKKR